MRYQQLQIPTMKNVIQPATCVRYDQP